ncbi:hypothetical protein GOP47_0028798 [Adiantum capillus-veneris]|nr:hypothetical protein GOP47_0028798 [Adiantum capillus-veneris]
MTNLDANNTDTSFVTKSLQLSYDRLAPSCQAAFLDVVSIFYRWSWETVERIVGVLIMRDLKNSSLSSQVDGIEKCNQNALIRRGYDSDWWYNTSPTGNFDSRVVPMHDLTLRFGESILGACNQLANIHYRL